MMGRGYVDQRGGALQHRQTPQIRSAVFGHYDIDVTAGQRCDLSQAIDDPRRRCPEHTSWSGQEAAHFPIAAHV
jgi:hypothetical protein